MTTKIRNKIIEIIVGILLIIYTLNSVYKTVQLYFPDFYFSYLKYTEPKDLLIIGGLLFGLLFFSLVGFMLVFSVYRGLPLKIAYCIMGLAAFIFSSGSIIVYNYFTSPIIGRMPASLMIRYMGGSIILGVAIVFGFLTINRNIIWKSRRNLLIYAYILMASLIVIGVFDWMVAIVILLPFFMQEYTEKKDTKGLVGGISLIAGIALPMALFYIYRRFLSSHIYSSDGNSSFLDYLSSSNDGYSAVKTVSNVLMYVLMLIAPFMIFERKCGEAETAASEKGEEEKTAAVIDDTDASAMKTEVADGDDNND